MGYELKKSDTFLNLSCFFRDFLYTFFSKCYFSHSNKCEHLLFVQCVPTSLSARLDHAIFPKSMFLFCLKSK